VKDLDQKNKMMLILDELINSLENIGEKVTSLTKEVNQANSEKQRKNSKAYEDF
jgi:hypothetical protein